MADKKTKLSNIVNKIIAEGSPADRRVAEEINATSAKLNEEFEVRPDRVTIRLEGPFTAEERTTLIERWTRELENSADGEPDCQDEDADTEPTRKQRDLRTFVNVARGLNLPTSSLDYCLDVVRGNLKDLEAEARCDGTPHPDDDQSEAFKMTPEQSKWCEGIETEMDANAKKAYAVPPATPEHESGTVLEEILGTIEREHLRARSLHTADDQNTPNDWIAFITGYASRCGEFPFNEVSYLQNLTKTAALCVSAMVAYSKYGLVARHYDNEFLDKKGVKILSQKETED